MTERVIVGKELTMHLRRLPLYLLLVGTLVLSLAVSKSAISCMLLEMPTKSKTASVALPGDQKAELYLAYYEESVPSTEGTDPKGRCSANIRVPLSAYPTSRVVARPADFREPVVELLRKLELKDCEMRVWYDNDTDEEIPAEEMCVKGTIGVVGTRALLLDRETSCFPNRFDD